MITAAVTEENEIEVEVEIEVETGIGVGVVIGIVGWIEIVRRIKIGIGICIMRGVG